MTKKLFGLISVTALTGLAMAASSAGCSAGTTYIISAEGGPGDTNNPGLPGAKDGGKDGSGPITKSDGGPIVKFDGSASGGTCPTTDPITGADIDAQLLWKPPAAPVNVCTQTNINALKTLFAGATSVKYSDIKTALGTSCAGCAFSSPITGLKWAVFVEDGSGGAIDNRTGSCMAQREGTACGKASFQFEECLSAACPDSDCGASGVDACQQKAATGACQGLATAFQSACPNLSADVDRCGNIFDSIAHTCSGGINHTIDTTP